MLHFGCDSLRFLSPRCGQVTRAAQYAALASFVSGRRGRGDDGASPSGNADDGHGCCSSAYHGRDRCGGRSRDAEHRQQSRLRATLQPGLRRRAYVRFSSSFLHPGIRHAPRYARLREAFLKLRWCEALARRLEEGNGRARLALLKLRSMQGCARRGSVKRSNQSTDRRFNAAVRGQLAQLARAFGIVAAARKHITPTG